MAFVVSNGYAANRAGDAPNGSVGVIEFCRGNFGASAAYFEKSILLDEKIGAIESDALARQNLGEDYDLLGWLPEALDQY